MHCVHFRTNIIGKLRNPSFYLMFMGYTAELGLTLRCHQFRRTKFLIQNQPDIAEVATGIGTGQETWGYLILEFFREILISCKMKIRCTLYVKWKTEDFFYVCKMGKSTVLLAYLWSSCDHVRNMWNNFNLILILHTDLIEVKTKDEVYL